MIARRSLLPILFAAACLVVGCERAPIASGTVPAESVQSLGQGGPVAITFRVAPTTLTTAERISVRMEARYNAANDPGEIDLAKSLPEGLSIVDVQTDRRASGPDSTLLIREWTVEPFLAGEYEIAPLALAGVETAPVKVTVNSVLKPGEEELAEAKPVVEPPAEFPRWGWWAIGAGVLLVAALTALIIAARRRASRPPEPVYIAAHDLAMQRLSVLMSRRLVESGRFKEFYEEASLILRRYIEDRFGLHAPERTTEEFLAETRTSAVLMEEDVRVLRRFLGHCDMVKFAAVTPSTPEAEGVAQTVREFVDRTKDAARLVIAEEAAAA